MERKRLKIGEERHITERELYWNNHIKKHEESGLSRKKYCKENGINYDKFSYWAHKFISKSSSLLPRNSQEHQLLPVEMKSEESKVSKFPLSVCLKGGSILEIHNQEGLKLILERFL